MVETLKFVYIVILFVSLFLVVALGQRECDTDEECYKKYPSTIPVTMICFEGTIPRMSPSRSIESLVKESVILTTNAIKNIRPLLPDQ
ncbi:hypothetical protein P8452_59798 [Trifolium repens]|nr:hypothetical protein P8452_59798 [Trifolium repens]